MELHFKAENNASVNTLNCTSLMLQLTNLHILRMIACILIGRGSNSMKREMISEELSENWWFALKDRISLRIH